MADLNPNTEPVTGTVSTNKMIIIGSIAGVTIVTSIVIGTLMPDARSFIVDMCKMALNSIPVILK